MPISDPKPLLGLPEIDEQHAYLYKLFDAIEHSSTVADHAATKALLCEIEGYLLFHFDSEELLMRHYHFPHFSMHQSDHEAGAARYVRFMDDFDNNRLNPGALRIFLTGWLMEHTASCDSEYAAWVKKCRAAIQGV